MSLSVVLAGGGTAGHVNPLLATAAALRARGATVHAVGTAGGLEADLVPAAGVELSMIERVPFPRRPDLNAIKFPMKYRAAVRHGGAILDHCRADVVVGFGGFASTPMYAAAKSRNLPVVIHEQNAKPGLANRYGARFAAAVALTFASTPLAAKNGMTQTVGLPLRASIASLAMNRADATMAVAARQHAAAELGLDPSLPTLVVTGGSLGAQHLNEALMAALDAIRASGIQVFHLTGKGKDGAVRSALEAAGGYARYHVRDYLTQMELAYSVADLVLARAGAGTVAELCALGLPSFLVPLAIGNGEQEKNAADVIRAGGALLVRDKEFSAVDVSGRIVPLLGEPEKLAEMSRAARGLVPADAADRLADIILRVGEKP